jgi:drug/metabolite transporter (DMT)-like permease
MSVLVLDGLPLTFWLCFTILPRHSWRTYATSVLWVFGAVTVLRSITNILSQRYTLAIYVQLIGLLTPFLVVLLNRVVLKERAPRFTLPALLLIMLGALLMMSDIDAAGVKFSLTQTDWIGIALALASSLFLALYMILVRRAAHTAASGSAVLAFQTVLIQLSAFGLSLLWGEEWGRWLTISALDWGVFVAYSLFVVVVANGLQIAAIRHLGAPMVSSLMRWRLVATLSLRMLLLGERLTSFWQGAGMFLVLGTITWYLSRQR